MKKICSILALIAVCVGLTSCRSGIAREINTKEKTTHLYLVAGFDDAAENTDALFTLGYDKNENLVSVAQIPRDTYFGFGKSQNKINQIYAAERSGGADRWEAMNALSEQLSSALGIQLDGFVGVTTGALRRIVDALGGIDIEVSSDVEIKDNDGSLFLKAGENRINGEQAEFFVRHRRGYTMGDLGRMDAQKVFLNALFRRISNGLTLPAIISLVRAVEGDLTTNVNISELTRLFLSNVSSMATARSVYATLPGEPILSKSGLSYYVLNKRAAEKMTKEFMYRSGEFDKDGVFLNESDTGFVNIYRDDGISYNKYYSDDIKNIKITKTNYVTNNLLLEDLYDDRFQTTKGPDSC